MELPGTADTVDWATFDNDNFRNLHRSSERRAYSPHAIAFSTQQHAPPRELLVSPELTAKSCISISMKRRGKDWRHDRGAYMYVCMHVCVCVFVHPIGILKANNIYFSERTMRACVCEACLFAQKV